MTAASLRRRIAVGAAPARTDLLAIVAGIGASVLVLALLARILTFPLSHDEQIHVAAARLIGDAPLYRTLGYNHLPGLPRLLGTIDALVGATHLLLVGRLTIFACWIATGAVLAWIARRAGAGRGVAALACLLLAATPLLGPAGMLVTNNFLPIPFALAAVQCLILAVARAGDRGVGWAIAAGACAMAAVLLKISFVALLPPLALAALLAPMPGAARLTRVVLPALAGAVLASLPVLPDLLQDPAATYIHTVRYFLGPHRDYWAQATAAKAMSLVAKVLIAEQVWLAGGALLAALLAGAMAWLGRASRAPRWPLLLLGALAASFALISFAPTPAFPQYYLPPVPFVVMAMVVGYGRLGERERAAMRPLLGIAGLLALATIAPRLGALPALARPHEWTGIAIHRDSLRMRAAVAAIAGDEAGIATLSPIRALEAGMRPYPEFAAGPFVYRVAELIPAAERGAYTTTSATDLARFLDARRPAAILTGDEPSLDPAFEAYAQTRGYRRVRLDDPALRLFVLANPASGALPLSSSGPRKWLIRRSSRRAAA